MSDEIAQEARSRRLNGLAKYLQEHPSEAPAPSDPALEQPLATEPVPALEQMLRRGLHPELVKVVLDWFEDRPLERGLFAWDVLCGSLLQRDDEAFLELLGDAARPIREVVPALGEGYIYTARVSPEEMVERLALPAFEGSSGDPLQAGLAVNALGAIEALKRDAGLEFVQSSPIPDALLRFAGFLNLAHLPTLASFYLAYLWRTLDYRPALPVYAEVMLDAHARVGLPTHASMVVTGASDEVDLEGYVTGRRLVYEGKPEEVLEKMRAVPERPDYAHESPAELAESAPRSHLLFADAGLAAGELTVPLQVINEIVSRDPQWRYASRVMMLTVAAIAPPESGVPLQVLDGILTGLGNDGELWLRLLRNAAGSGGWWDGVRARALREAMMLPHDTRAWQGLIAVSRAENTSGLLDELSGVVAAQCPAR